MTIVGKAGILTPELLLLNWFHLHNALRGLPPQEAARRVLAAAQVFAPPVDVFTIMQMAGVRHEFQRAGWVGGGTVSINRAVPQMPLIVLRSHDALGGPGRTLAAHAFGHVVLHPQGYRCVINTGTKLSFEHAATNFACHLLVPMWLFESALQRTTDEAELAAMFDVPTTVINAQTSALLKGYR